MTSLYYVQYQTGVDCVLPSGMVSLAGRWIPMYVAHSEADALVFLDSLPGVNVCLGAIPDWLRIHHVVDPAGKPQALVAAHESDKQVSAPTARIELPVQRVLVSPFHVLRTLFGEPISRSLRPAFARLHPSWAPVSARWPLAVLGSQMPLPLVATQTASPILASDLQRQKRALRADLRAIRVGGNC